MTDGGIFYDKQHEIEIVKDYLESRGVPYLEIRPCPDANAADVIIRMEDGSEYTVELKEELAHRWMRYHQLGIDGITVFSFSSPEAEQRWRGRVWNADNFYDFNDDIDYDKGYKDGKLFYSQSDIWLFAGYDYDGSYNFLEGYLGTDIVNDDFIDFVRDNCAFAINKKSGDYSSGDTWNSLVWFVNPENMPAPVEWR